MTGLFLHNSFFIVIQTGTFETSDSSIRVVFYLLSFGSS